MLSLSEILTHFPPAKKIGRDYRTVCPVHGDSPAHPSLCISEGQQAILFKCETKGCAVADIIGSASPPLVWRDIFAETNGNVQSPQLVYTATFVDEDGHPLYASLRYEPKGFRVRAANGNWSIAGVRRVLYRLPELTGQKFLWYVEGPQKADALWRLGIPATCHIGGVTGWAPHQAEYLQQLQAVGCQGLVCSPDNDAAGAVVSTAGAASAQSPGLARGGCGGGFRESLSALRA